MTPSFIYCLLKDQRQHSSTLADLSVVSANEGDIQNAIGDKNFAKARGCQLCADNDGTNRKNPEPPVVRSMSKKRKDSQLALD